MEGCSETASFKDGISQLMFLVTHPVRKLAGLEKQEVQLRGKPMYLRAIGVWDVAKRSLQHLNKVLCLTITSYHGH